MKLCTVQPHMSDSIDKNVIEITRWIRTAAESGADVVLFPELMLTGWDQHLHKLFKIPKWYAQIEEALLELGKIALQSDVSVLVGSPYRIGDGYLNALVLLQSGETPILAGGRTQTEKGMKKHWGFVEAQDRSPMSIQGISFGAVFCAETDYLDQTRDKGLEQSDVILWPSGAINSEKNKRNEVTRDNSSDGARKIARYYEVPVIQANYISYASQEQNTQEEARGRMLGGSVACDAAGRVLEQASWTKEDMLLIDIKRDSDTIIVKSAGNSTDRAVLDFK